VLFDSRGTVAAAKKRKNDLCLARAKKKNLGEFAAICRVQTYPFPTAGQVGSGAASRVQPASERVMRSVAVQHSNDRSTIEDARFAAACPAICRTSATRA
jgi:hypothetical protein